MLVRLLLLLHTARSTTVFPELLVLLPGGLMLVRLLLLLLLYPLSIMFLSEICVRASIPPVEGTLLLVMAFDSTLLLLLFRLFLRLSMLLETKISYSSYNSPKSGSKTYLTDLLREVLIIPIASSYDPSERTILLCKSLSSLICVNRNIIITLIYYSDQQTSSFVSILETYIYEYTNKSTLSIIFCL